MSGALVAWACWCAITIVAVIRLQGQSYLLLWLPSWILSSVYPLAKRYVIFPQLFLGSACVAAFIPAWATGGGGLRRKEVMESLPLAMLVMCWITYIDMFYATMVRHAFLFIHYLVLQFDQTMPR